MLRFIQVLMLNAWRGMRRAKGTPAFIVAFIAVCVLFVGSNASARASIQTAMHVVGLPVALTPDTDSDSTTQAKDTTVSTNNTTKHASAKHDSDTAGKSESVNGKATQNSSRSNAQALSATVSLSPSTITPECQQGVSIYTVKSAQIALSGLTSSAGDYTWAWETRIDSGSSDSTPVNAATHYQGYDAGVQIEQINSSDPSQLLLSAAANANYAYSFRLDISGPFTASSPWISVPQSSSTTCP